MCDPLLYAISHIVYSDRYPISTSLCKEGNTDFNFSSEKKTMLQLQRKTNHGGEKTKIFHMLRTAVMILFFELGIRSFVLVSMQYFAFKNINFLLWI